jgi:Uncharacterized conserved protein (DUF2088).
MRIRLAYGRKGLTIELPDRAAVTVIEPEFVPGLEDERTALRAALASPIGCPPLPELDSFIRYCGRSLQRYYQTDAQ